MQLTKPVGRNASAMKYDILSALGVYALSGDKYRQRLCLRLIVLITARYNWQRDELSIGRAEIARLWSVDERTVKREVGKLKAMGWLTVKRPGARGRVTVYGLEIGLIVRDTSEQSAKLGNAFEQRVDLKTAASDGETIVQFPQKLKNPLNRKDIWGQILQEILQYHPMEYEAWLSSVEFLSFADNAIYLRAKSGFAASYIRTHHQNLIFSAANRAGIVLEKIHVSA